MDCFPEEREKKNGKGLWLTWGSQNLCFQWDYKMNCKEYKALSSQRRNRKINKTQFLLWAYEKKMGNHHKELSIPFLALAYVSHGFRSRHKNLRLVVPCYSKSGLWISSIGDTWELIKTAESQASPHTTESKSTF